MTYINSQQLFQVNQELLSLSSFAPQVHGKVECFSFKKNQNNMYKQLFGEQFSGSPNLSTFENGSLVATQVHFSAILASFSSAFPDLDFSTVCPWNFKLVPSVEKAQCDINWAFQTELSNCENFVGHLWAVLEKEIAPSNCYIYSYEPDRPDAFSESGVSFNMTYFFLNEKLNRVVLIHLREGANEFSSCSENEQDFDSVYGYDFDVF